MGPSLERTKQFAPAFTPTRTKGTLEVSLQGGLSVLWVHSPGQNGSVNAWGCA